MTDGLTEGEATRERSTPDGPRSPGTIQGKLRNAPDPGFVAVGRILGPFGLKGEVKVQSLTDNAGRFAARSRLYADEEPIIVASSREAGGYLYLRFKGYADRTSVEPLRHRMLQVPEGDLPALESGEYYRFQLIGLEAAGRDGSSLGTVVEVIETGANDVLRIERTGTADLLVPLLADTLVSVDLDGRRIVLDPPDWR